MYHIFSLPPGKLIITVLFNFSALSGCILGVARQAFQKGTLEPGSVGKGKVPTAAQLPPAASVQLLS